MERVEIRAVCTLAVCLAALGTALPAPGQEAGAAAPAEQKGRAEPGGGWWNNPRIVEALTLTEAQRKKMDGHLDAFHKALSGQGPGSLSEFYTAVEEGKWDAAQSALKSVADHSTERIMAQGTLKISVLRELDDAQRKTLNERYAKLIRQPWGTPPRRGQRGPR